MDASTMHTMQFQTAVVMTVVTGALLCELDQLYKFLNRMTGRLVLTHQLASASEEVKRMVLKQRPYLDTNVIVNPSNYHIWKRKWIEQFGFTITLEVEKC